MDYKIDSVSNLVYELKLNLPADDVKVEIEAKLNTLRKTVSIPGFRKGKVPLELVKARYTKDIEADVFDNLINKNFQEIMKTEDYQIIGGGVVKSIDWKPEEVLNATIEFQVVPQVKLRTINKLSVVKEVREITDEDIENIYQRLREQHAVIKPVENGAQMGHFILADFQEIDESGVPIIGKKLKDRSFRLGGGVFGEKFDKQLLEVKTDEERPVQVSFQTKTGENKIEHYKVKIKKIEEQILPELDDDFAKSIGEFKNIEELKKALTQQFKNEIDRGSREKLHENLVDELIKQNPLDLPPIMINSYLDAWFEDVKKRAKHQLKEDELKQQNRHLAIRNLKWHMLKDELIKQENLNVDDAEVEKKLTEMAQNTNVDLDKVKAHYRNKEHRAELIRQLEDKRVFDRLLETAKVKETSVSAKQSNLIETI